jgi:hypothetical protein
MILAPHAVPPDWALRCGGGPLTIGNDVATTEKKTSNPSAFTVMEKLNGIYWQRLIVRFKSEDPEVPEQILTSILDARPARDWKNLHIDASSERLNAQRMRKKFRARLPVFLVVNSEAIDWTEGGNTERFSYKTLLGDLYCSAFEDNRIALPPEAFILTDHRLVKKQSGGYVTEVDEGGNHGDTFDSGKLAYWGHISKSGKVSAEGMQVGEGGGKPAPLKNRPGLIGPLSGGRTFGRTLRRLSS